MQNRQQLCKKREYDRERKQTFAEMKNLENWKLGRQEDVV
jgi:hypothetical protein